MNIARVYPAEREVSYDMRPIAISVQSGEEEEGGGGGGGGRRGRRTEDETLASELATLRSLSRSKASAKNEPKQSSLMLHIDQYGLAGGDEMEDYLLSMERDFNSGKKHRTNSNIDKNFNEIVSISKAQNNISFFISNSNTSTYESISLEEQPMQYNGRTR